MQSSSINVVQTSLVFYLCIAFISMELVIAFCTFRELCDSKMRVLSRTPPRYLTLLLSSMRAGPTLIGFCATLLSCCFDPNNMYSLFSKLSLICILSIQYLMLLYVSFNYCLVVISCCVFPVLNVFHREWSY